MHVYQITQERETYNIALAVFYRFATASEEWCIEARCSFPITVQVVRHQVDEVEISIQYVYLYYSFQHNSRCNFIQVCIIMQVMEINALLHWIGWYKNTNDTMMLTKYVILLINLK